MKAPRQAREEQHRKQTERERLHEATKPAPAEVQQPEPLRLMETPEPAPSKDTAERMKQTSTKWGIVYHVEHEFGGEHYRQTETEMDTVFQLLDVFAPLFPGFQSMDDLAKLDVLNFARTLFQSGAAYTFLAAIRDRTDGTPTTADEFRGAPARIIGDFLEDVVTHFFSLNQSLAVALAKWYVMSKAMPAELSPILDFATDSHRDGSPISP